MTFYHSTGDIPPKRHTQFRGEGGVLRSEELFSSRGFDGPYSLLYHVGAPTEVTGIALGAAVKLESWIGGPHRHHIFDTQTLASRGDILTSRQAIVFNEELVLSAATPDEASSVFYRNALADELVIVAEGSGALFTPFGRLDYVGGDMIVIPRGTIQEFRPGLGTRLFILESKSPITLPDRYYAGRQLAEHSPFCERDFKLPKLQPPRTERGEFVIRTKLAESTSIYTMVNHPFDVIGWDGALFPYAVNMENFEPVTRRIHTMPDEQQAFGSKGAVVCCIVPRLLDYHPDALPTPPFHSSLDCDEVMINLGNSMMGWQRPAMGVVTFHPRGLPHGPKPGTPEKSIGMKMFDGKAILIDTFQPLTLAEGARRSDDPTYHDEWLKHPINRGVPAARE